LAKPHLAPSAANFEIDLRDKRRGSLDLDQGYVEGIMNSSQFGCPTGLRSIGPLATAAVVLFGCGDSTGGRVDETTDDTDELGADASVDTGVGVGSIGPPGLEEWADVHYVQVINGPNRVEIWARNAKWQLIGRIALERFGETRMIASSEYADGGLAVEVIAEMGFESYSVIYQTLEDEELTARAAAIEDLLYQGSVPDEKWLACGVSAVLTVPACIGPLALISCIPTTVVAGCKCTKAALNLPNEKAGICENI
jgi:hypothetical protein